MKKSDIKKIKPEKWARDWKNDPVPEDATTVLPPYTCSVCKKRTWKFHNHQGQNRSNTKMQVKKESDYDTDYF